MPNPLVCVPNWSSDQACGQEHLRSPTDSYIEIGGNRGTEDSEEASLPLVSWGAAPPLLSLLR